MNERISAANRVTCVGFCLNLVLPAFKLLAGIVGHSKTMVADAINSLSPLGTDRQ